MLPLARFLTLRSNQLFALSKNVGHADLYNSFCRKAYNKGSQLIADFIDHLTNEHTRFVPEDGNVHEITSNTMNFMKILAKYQPVVSHVLENSQKATESKLSKLFGLWILSNFTYHFSAQIIAALGVNLKNKAGAYADPTLSALFLFNNLTYVDQCLREGLLTKLIKEQNPQFFTFNDQEIASNLKKYLLRFGL
jgi:hypothetical protein